MQPQAENYVYEAAQRLASGLMNNQIGHVYPALVPVLHTLGMDISNVFTQLLGQQRSEMFYGESPWAKMYEIQTGKKIEVPDRAILKNICPERGFTVPQMPWEDVLDYFLAGWANPEGDEEWHFFLDGPEDYDNQVILNFKRKDAVYYWENNDMQLVLPNFARSAARLECPLFHVPYDVDVELSYVQRTLYDQVLARMLEIWEIEPVTVEDSSFLISQHYYGTRENPIEVPDEHNVKQLAVLLEMGGFGKANRSYVYVDDWNGYRLQFSTKRDWNCNPSTILKVSVMHLLNDDDRNHDRTVNYWWKNPLLVADLLADMDNLLQGLIDRHELEMKEV
jgi:hypothetical protein